MRTLGLSLATLAVLLVAGESAQADPVRRLGIGLRSTGLTTAGDHDPDNQLHLAGGGLQVRYRLRSRLSLELTMEGLRADLAGGAYVRDSVPVTLSVLWHVVPRFRWDPYLILGAGGTEDEVSYRNAIGATVTETFHETQVHMGAGIERRLGRFGLGGELRFVGLVRSGQDGDGPTYGTIPYGPVAASSSGAQASLTATYYF